MRSIPITLLCKSPLPRDDGHRLEDQDSDDVLVLFLFVCMLLWNHIRFIFAAKNFGWCDLSIYRLVFCGREDDNHELANTVVDLLRIVDFFIENTQE